MNRRGPSTKPWGTPWDKRGRGGGAVVDVDELLSVNEVRSEPGKGSAGDVNGGLKAVEKDEDV